MTDLLVKRIHRRRPVLLALTLFVTAACAADPLPPSEGSGPANRTGDEVAEQTSSVAAEGNVAEGEVLIDDNATAVPFDRRLLGTNVPAWLGPQLLGDPKFQAETKASGTTLLRMPGGSWSNAYDWRACELVDESGCFWTWAARPSDFIDFMQATGTEGMWTVSINQTAQSAAAAVAFFNGSVDDDTEIGTDRSGVDWATVGFWAQVRSDGGNPEPVDIELWEVGNEVYGGAPSSGGSQCASFGWEDVWTCDGAEYVSGTDEHDGYLDIRRAMLAVDPGIEVGAVGVSAPESWSGWGSEVIDSAGDDLDFYVIHDYGFDASPTPDQALERPAELWPSTMSSVRERLSPDVPVAVTEYNLVAFDAGDTDATMAAAANAFFVADSIGQLARSGATIANQWNLANGTADSGTDYGLIELDSVVRRPQFEGFAAWRDAGTELYPAEVGDKRLHVYPTRHDDGRWTIVVINMADESLPTSFEFARLDAETTMTARSVVASDLLDSSVDVIADVVVYEPTSLELPATSITTINVTVNGNA